MCCFKQELTSEELGGPIGRIHGAIVPAIVAAAGWSDRRDDRSPVVYTRGDCCRGDDRSVYTLCYGSAKSTQIAARKLHMHESAKQKAKKNDRSTSESDTKAQKW